MPDEILENQPGEGQNPNPNPNQNYIDAINNLRQNSVPRTDYDKLKAENQQLLDSLVNGTEIEVPEEEKRPLADLRKELFAKDADFSNLEYAERVLELRDRVLEEEGVDVFVAQNTEDPQGAKESAERVANTLRECIQRANGNSNIFTAELQNRIVDSVIIPGRR